jgi:hypothetical protein
MALQVGGLFSVGGTTARSYLAAVGAGFRPIRQAHFVLSARLATVGRIEALLVVTHLFFDGVGKGFVALHAKQHLVLH